MADRRSLAGMLTRELLRSIADLEPEEREGLAVQLEKMGKHSAARNVRAMGPRPAHVLQ